MLSCTRHYVKHLYVLFDLILQSTILILQMRKQRLKEDK